MIEAAESFCQEYDGTAFYNSFQAAIVGFSWEEAHESGLNIFIRLEAKYNCRWVMNKDECNKQLLHIIDDCDTDTVMDKQGGVRENNCLVWQIDPE